MSHFTHIKTGTCDSEYTSPVGVVPGGNAPAMVMYLMQKVEELESKQAIIGKQTGDKSFTFVQSQSSDTWVIIHNLNKFPSVQIQDSAGTYTASTSLFTETDPAEGAIKKVYKLVNFQ